MPRHQDVMECDHITSCVQLYNYVYDVTEFNADWKRDVGHTADAETQLD